MPASFDLAAVEEGIQGTEFAGYLMHFPSLASTSTLALEAAQSGVRHGVWVADEQTAGRGRGNHQWHSAPGDGLYVSALVTPPISMRMGLWISLATGLAAQAAIREVAGLEIDIRWPNDLMLDGRKCGGILVETAVATAEKEADARLRYAVIGIGINMNHAEFPDELRQVATSLRIASGVATSREMLLAALLRHLDEEIRLLIRQWRGTHNGKGTTIRFAAASTWVKGKRVRVDEAGGYNGVTAGLNIDGFLQVAGDDGILHTVISGGVREE